LIRKESRGAHVRVDIHQTHDAQHSPFGHTYLSQLNDGIEQNGAGT
jgi:fumarate reductase (CoM/CoB) subunit A